MTKVISSRHGRSSAKGCGGMDQDLLARVQQGDGRAFEVLAGVELGRDGVAGTAQAGAVGAHHEIRRAGWPDQPIVIRGRLSLGVVVDVPEGRE